MTQKRLDRLSLSLEGSFAPVIDHFDPLSSPPFSLQEGYRVISNMLIFSSCRSKTDINGVSHTIYRVSRVVKLSIKKKISLYLKMGLQESRRTPSVTRFGWM